MIEPLENLSVRPDEQQRAVTAGDLLSHVLAQIRLTGDDVAARTLAAGEPLALEAGEAYILLPTAGALCIEEASHPPALAEAGGLLLMPRGSDGVRLTAAGDGASVIVCRFWFDPDSLRGMIFALPRTIHIKRDEAEGWIEGITHFMMLEADDVQPGAALMIARLIDLIVIRALRTWVHRGDASGWLGGLADARISRALKAIHEQPMQRWGIDVLARVAGMSRSSFCDRFAAIVGRSPLRYQNEWRLGLARDMLARRDARVGEIGLRIGYASEAAFSRAYKDLFGHAPRADYARHEARD